MSSTTRRVGPICLDGDRERKHVTRVTVTAEGFSPAEFRLTVKQIRQAGYRPDKLERSLRRAVYVINKGVESALDTFERVCKHVIRRLQHRKVRPSVVHTRRPVRAMAIHRSVPSRT